MRTNPTKGTGESGKSTVAKQMKIMHLNGFTPKEKETFRVIIHTNIIEGVATLVTQSEIFGLSIREDLQVRSSLTYRLSVNTSTSRLLNALRNSQTSPTSSTQRLHVT